MAGRPWSSIEAGPDGKFIKASPQSAASARGRNASRRRSRPVLLQSYKTSPGIEAGVQASVPEDKTRAAPDISEQNGLKIIG